MIKQKNEKPTSLKPRKTINRRFSLPVTPVLALVSGYALITLAGAILLSLPISSSIGTPSNFVDALFMSSSGISTTGLVTLDPGSQLSLFGQIVLLVVFQIGGIGYMPLFIIAFSFFSPRLSIHSQTIARESSAFADYLLVKHFFIFILRFTILCELSGALILGIIWFDPAHIFFSLYSALFHSISAFCTAGFSLYADSLMRYSDNIIVNAVINIESLLGGIGFFVIYDIVTTCMRKEDLNKRKGLSLHTKIALLTTGLIIVSASVMIFMMENGDTGTTIENRWMYSVFQTVSASTTDGYNTVDISKMSAGSLLVIIILMFIGASPGSTGGGIKTTTLGVIFLFTITLLKGRNNGIMVLKREIAQNIIMKALAIFTMSVFFIIFDLLVLVNTEKAGFLELLFEIFSALGNTGLSMGITAKLSDVGKVLLSFTMFIGRVGPVTLGLSLLSLLASAKTGSYHLPKENVFVG
jgi:trk system potassium uptake protein TrkH